MHLGICGLGIQGAGEATRYCVPELKGDAQCFFEQECLSKYSQTEAPVSIKKGKSRREQLLPR